MSKNKRKVIFSIVKNIDKNSSNGTILVEHGGSFIMKKNNKGFTLIELLAVIVILGLLMAIAIPSVTRYITQSRKKTLISSVDSYVTAVTTAVNDNEFGAMSKEDTMYYVPVSNEENNSCISLEKGGTNPFGNWKEAYVVVNYDAESYSYDYYFTFIDDAGYGSRQRKLLFA